MSLRLLRVMASRWTRLVLVGLFLLGIQTTILNEMRPFGVMVQLMLLIGVTAGAIYGPEVGAISGLIVGLMYDCVLTTPLGLASLVFGAVGFGAGLLPFFVRDPSWWNRAIVIALSSAVGELLFPIAQGMTGLSGWVQPRMFIVALTVAMINLFLAPIISPLVRWTLKQTLIG
jgi:rod shape-determining protein MreD